MAKLSVDDILDGIKELSIVEAAELSKKIEEEFGIQAAAPMAVGVAAPGAGGAGAAEEEAEEKTEFDVVLTAAGDKKIQVIKEVRALSSWWRDWTIAERLERSGSNTKIVPSAIGARMDASATASTGGESIRMKSAVSRSDSTNRAACAPPSMAAGSFGMNPALMTRRLGIPGSRAAWARTAPSASRLASPRSLRR